MTQEEILDYNKRCAEFLNAKYEPESHRYVFQKQLTDTEYTLRKSTRHHREQMCFHSDWNWIMEVVEAIEQLENVRVKMLQNSCDIFVIDKDKFITVTKTSKQEAVVEAINQFLIWYNENN